MKINSHLQPMLLQFKKIQIHQKIKILFNKIQINLKELSKFSNILKKTLSLKMNIHLIHKLDKF